jgi:hypothetical protein
MYAKSQARVAHSSIANARGCPWARMCGTGPALPVGRKVYEREGRGERGAQKGGQLAKKAKHVRKTAYRETSTRQLYAGQSWPWLRLGQTKLWSWLKSQQKFDPRSTERENKSSCRGTNEVIN